MDVNDKLNGSEFIELMLISSDEDFIDGVLNVYEKNLISSDEGEIQKRKNEYTQVLILGLSRKFNTKTKKVEVYEFLDNYIKNVGNLIQSDINFIKEKLEKSIENYKKFNELCKEESIKQSYSPSMIKTIESITRNQITSSEIVGNLVYRCIYLKLVSKYNKFLPKTIYSKFKEDYKHLYASMVRYKIFKKDIEAKEEYIRFHNNEGISDVVQNLHKCKEIENKGFGNIEVKHRTSKGNHISLDINTSEGLDMSQLVKKVNERIGASQSQLIVYIMSLAFSQNKGEDTSQYCKVDIDVKEYCKLKGIKYRTDVADEIYKNIENLQDIIIEYEYTNQKGDKDVLRKSSLFSNRGIIDQYEKDGKKIRNQIVSVSLGKWIETLNYTQFQFLNKAFFKYNLSRNRNAIIPISYYINCLHRNNLKNEGNEFKLKVINLSDKLSVEEGTIKAKGYKKAIKIPLEKTLNDIKDAEGFNWSYKNGNHNSREEFEADVIYFTNSSLDNLYNEKGYTKKKSKAKKSKAK
jgi:hypothetical protein